MGVLVLTRIDYLFLLICQILFNCCQKLMLHYPSITCTEHKINLIKQNSITATLTVLDRM